MKPSSPAQVPVPRIGSTLFRRLLCRLAGGHIYQLLPDSEHRVCIECLSVWRKV